MSREALLARTLVELADTLVDDFDVVHVLTLLTDRCVEVLDVAAAGLMLAFPEGELQVIASSSEAMRLLELFELQAAEGPCPDSYRTGEPIVNRRLQASGGPWPEFSPRALEAGFHSVHALPLRLRDVTIGALNLFRSAEGALSDADVAAARALADVATIAVLQHRAVRDTQAVNGELHHALNSRVVIEQAKGMVAEREGLDMDQAFSTLRTHARSHSLRVVDVAHGVIAGDLAPQALDTPATPPPRPVEARPLLDEALGALGRIEPVLDLVEAAAPVDAVEVVASALAAKLGAEEVSFLIAGFGGDSLVRFLRPSNQGSASPARLSGWRRCPSLGRPTSERCSPRTSRSWPTAPGTGCSPRSPGDHEAESGPLVCGKSPFIGQCPAGIRLLPIGRPPVGPAGAHAASLPAGRRRGWGGASASQDGKRESPAGAESAWKTLARHGTAHADTVHPERR